MQPVADRDAIANQIKQVGKSRRPPVLAMFYPTQHSLLPKREQRPSAIIPLSLVASLAFHSLRLMGVIRDLKFLWQFSETYFTQGYIVVDAAPFLLIVACLSPA